MAGKNAPAFFSHSPAGSVCYAGAESHSFPRQHFLYFPEHSIQQLCRDPQLSVSFRDNKKEEKIVYLLKGETKNRFKSFLFRWFSLEKRTHTHIKMGNMYVIIIKGCST